MSSALSRVPFEFDVQRAIDRDFHIANIFLPTTTTTIAALSLEKNTKNEEGGFNKLLLSRNNKSNFPPLEIKRQRKILKLV